MGASSTTPGISRRSFFRFAGIALAAAIVPSVVASVVLAQEGDSTDGEADSQDDPPH